MESSDSTFVVANVYTLDKQNLSFPSKCFSFIKKQEESTLSFVANYFSNLFQKFQHKREVCSKY